jgi:hypothetical protein
VTDARSNSELDLARKKAALAFPDDPDQRVSAALGYFGIVSPGWSSHRAWTDSHYVLGTTTLCGLSVASAMEMEAPDASWCSVCTEEVNTLTRVRDNHARGVLGAEERTAPVPDRELKDAVRAMIMETHAARKITRDAVLGYLPAYADEDIRDRDIVRFRALIRQAYLSIGFPEYGER